MDEEGDRTPDQTREPPPAGASPAMVPSGWAALREHTAARIALGRAGAALPTAAHLDFQLAHARARDAVHAALDPAPLAEALAARGLAPVLLHSAAADRRTFLQRPDLGRRLDAPSRDRLEAAPKGWEAVFVLADGLSATAVQRHAVPLLDATLPALGRTGWRLGPAAVVLQGRVAVGDEIGAILETDLAVVLIGERPGLSSPDSLGVYLTWQPHPGVTDAGRNCLSNIRPEGLGYAAAAARLVWLMAEARRRRLSGVALKEEAGAELLPAPGDS